MTRRNYIQSLTGNEADMILEMLGIIDSNLPHSQPEVIDGFPSGNVYVGMTSEDRVRLGEITSHFGRRLSGLDYGKRNDEIPIPY